MYFILNTLSDRVAINLMGKDKHKTFIEQNVRNIIYIYIYIVISILHFWLLFWDHTRKI